MTGAELITLFRLLSKDNAEPYNFTDAEILGWCCEGEREIAARAQIIKDSVTPAVVRIAVVSGSGIYPVDDKVIAFTSVDLLDTDENFVRRLSQTSRAYMPDNWQYITGTPTDAIHDDTQLTLYPEPDSDYILQCDTIRFPLLDITEITEPEIAEVHHGYIVDYALYRAFQAEDSDTLSEQLSQRHYAIFERKYGKVVHGGGTRRCRANRYHRARICL